MEGLYTVSGFLVGLIVGITGVGGGSLMTPLLVLFFGVSPAVAVGTDLLYASLTKAVGGWVHSRNSTVDWPIVKLMALGSIPAALFTIAMFKLLELDEEALSRLVTGVLGVALIMTALALLLREKIFRLGHRETGIVKRLQQQYLRPATVVMGAIVGVLVTISSIGAGVLGTVALLFLYPHMQARKVVGTDIVHAVPLTAVAGLGHATMGTVDFILLGSLLLGSLPGIYLGSHLSAKIPDYILRPVLASLLLIIGLLVVR